MIREEIVIDASQGIAALNEMDRATVKYAQKQETLYKQANEQIQANEKELKRLKAVREASNSTASTERYDSAIKKLEADQVKLREETQKYGAAVKEESAQAAGAFKKMGQSAKLWIGIGVTGAIFGAYEGIKNLAKGALSFNDKMQQSLAIMGNVSKSMRNEMRKTARSVSTNLNIPADKAAQSFYYLASAGLNAKQSIAAMPAVARFSKAGMFDMAKATSLAVNAQTALGMRSEDAAKNLKNLKVVMDTLVRANTVADATTQQFAEALGNRAASAMKSMNIPLRQGIDLLAVLANNSYKGRRAGMMLSRMFRVVAKAANENRAEFEKLGIVTSKGQFGSAINIVRGLTQALKQMTPIQKMAALKQMGFNQRVSQVILLFNKMGKQIKHVDNRMKGYGGMTKEVADKQMKSLQQRLGKVKQAFTNAFGPDMIKMIKVVTNVITKLNDQFSRWSKGSQKAAYLKSLTKGYGGSETNQAFLIKAFKKQMQYSQSDMKGVKSDMFNIGGRIKFYQKKMNQQGTSDAERQSLQRVIDKLKKKLQYQVQTYERDKKIYDQNYKKYKQEAKNNDLTNNALNKIIKKRGINKIKLDETNQALEKYHKLQKSIASNAKTQKANSPKAPPSGGGNKNDAVANQIDKAKKEVESYKNQLQHLKNLKSGGDIGDAAYQKRVNDLQAKYLANLKKIYQFVKGKLNPQQEKSVGQMFSVFQNNTDAAQSALNIAKYTHQQSQQKANLFGGIHTGGAPGMGGFNNMAMGMQRVQSTINQMTAAITHLKNEQSAGIIDTKQLNKASRDIKQNAIKQLKALYKWMEKNKLLTPKLEKQFKKAFSAVGKGSKKGNKHIKKLSNTLHDIAGAAQGIANLASAFGGLGKKASQAIQGVSQTIEGGSKLAEGIASGNPLSMITGGIQAIGGLVKTFKGIFSHSGLSKQAMEKLRTSINDNIRAIKNNTKAYRQQSIQGGGFTKQQLQKALAINPDVVQGKMAQKSDIVSYFQMLQNEFPKHLSGLVTMFKDLKKTGLSTNDAFIKVMDGFQNFKGMGPFKGVNNIIKQMESTLGDYGHSIQGFVQQFNDTLNYGTESTSQAMSNFVSNLKGLGTKIPDALLNQLSGLDLSTAKGQKALKNIIQQIYAHREAYRGSLTQNQLDSLLSFLKGQETTAGSSSTTSSVQVANTITDVQANELLMFQENILSVLRSIFGALNDGFGLHKTLTSTYNPSINPINIPVPLPVKIVSGSSANNIAASTNSKTLQTGDITMSKGISDSDIDELTSQLKTKLKQELHGLHYHA